MGHDTDWQDVGTRRQAFYTDLPPRDYVFEVTASNNDGVWNPTGTRLAFSIAPTFYQTRTFTVLCVIAALAALWLVYLLRVRQIEMRLRLRMEERIDERERIARDLHDTLLQGLLSASLQLSVANNQIPADAPAKSLVERILQLLRQVVDDGRNAVRGLRTRDTAPEALERALAQIPQDLAMDEKVQFRLRVEGNPASLAGRHSRRAVPAGARGAGECIPALGRIVGRDRARVHAESIPPDRARQRLRHGPRCAAVGPRRSLGFVRDARAFDQDWCNAQGAERAGRGHGD